MELKPGMSLDEIGKYLMENLKDSIRNDIWPIVQADLPQGGYFAVPRSVFSYVDFLGALHGGYSGERYPSGQRKIATTAKAEKFIREILKEVDDLYGRNGALLYEMYRHGTVHLYRPHELRRSDGRVLSWLPYKGPRECRVSEPTDLDLRHLQPVKRDESSDWLPVSITCLYDDLVRALDVFWLKLQNNAQLVANWHSAASALCEAETTKLEWSTDCPC